MRILSYYLVMMMNDNAYKFRKQANGYPVALHSRTCGQFQIFDRPGDFLVRFYPGVGSNIARISASHEVGRFETIEQVSDAIAKTIAALSR